MSTTSGDNAMKGKVLLLLAAVGGLGCGGALAQTDRIDAGAQKVGARVIEWRRDFHQHPELSNRETRTAGIVAEHLRALGMEVRTGVAHTGVVGVLKGGKPGPVVALRADMDALPVTEEADVPFRSTAKGQYNGQEVGVMHACGHDAHIAILMGVAQVLADMRAELPGSVKFIFQPAEEGPPAGEKGGAPYMIEQGALEDPRPDAIFGLHVIAGIPAGVLTYRAGPLMASADWVTIRVHGRQTHGAWPWRGIDPVVTASQIVLGLQNIVSRQIDVSKEPAVVTIATINGGARKNIIPDDVEMSGTIRSFDEDMRADIHARIRHVAENIAQANQASAEVDIEKAVPVTTNDEALTERMLPTLRRVAGDNLKTQPRVMVAEDFSYFQQQVPGMFFFLGITPPDQDMAQAAPNHSPHFFVDESALIQGVRALSALAVDFLAGNR
ncbi:MAG: amidohydrolase [Burkholderiales bacterium]|nr:amidohydrolase [Burkholderiales bacterium]